MILSYVVINLSDFDLLEVSTTVFLVRSHVQWYDKLIIGPVLISNRFG